MSLLSQNPGGANLTAYSLPHLTNLAGKQLGILYYPVLGMYALRNVRTVNIIAWIQISLRRNLTHSKY